MPCENPAVEILERETDVARLLAAVAEAGEARGSFVLESVASYRQGDGSYRIANAFRFTLATRPATS